MNPNWPRDESFPEGGAPAWQRAGSPISLRVASRLVPPVSRVTAADCALGFGAALRPRALFPHAIRAGGTHARNSFPDPHQHHQSHHNYSNQHGGEGGRADEGHFHLSAFVCCVSGRVPCTAIYRRQSHRQQLRTAAMPHEKSQTANLPSMTMDSGFHALRAKCTRQNLGQSCTTRPGLVMSGFVNDTPRARSSRRHIFSARYCEAHRDGNGFAPQWKAAQRHGGSTCNAHCETAQGLTPLNSSEA